MWVFGSFWIAFAISERLVDRWNPQFRDGDLPPLEWITWLVIWALLTLVPFAILAELVPRAWTHLRERRSTGPA
jgi:hypothetical protein